MKRFEPENTFAGRNFEAWFRLDREEFSGEGDPGRGRVRSEKTVGRDPEGRLVLQQTESHGPPGSAELTCACYILSFEEYMMLLERAVKQGAVSAEARVKWIEKAQSPCEKPWDIRENVVAYRDDRFELGQANGRAYLTADGKTYLLSSHNYEPCTYISCGGDQTTVHNAFDPFVVLEAFQKGRCVTSITGREYAPADFCEMIAYAAGRGNIGIDEAERVFSRRWRLITEDPFFSLLARYPACVAEWYLIKNGGEYRQEASHRQALEAAMAAAAEAYRADGFICTYNVRKAAAKRISAASLFAPSGAAGCDAPGESYRTAFLYPPHGCNYTEADFQALNAALFPNGTAALEVFSWSTDWSNYFDDGHEWWGALCLSVYDKTPDRFAVILASATD